jgi:hypothetical protein
MNSPLNFDPLPHTGRNPSPAGAIIKLLSNLGNNI